ncbi:cytochrome P450 [Microdochium trichocladiopsis]|uniref:Cytochrome P450 n=1 Tax=Microdochium trichocladiopsis TaxID=1682393 RepID=A0A9P9BR29_9PEZI|nr:cytochrome P450 [Microdochium trichocladiopsis]KAH7031563.1 cytochrome P450 [Microdochium trichocladiopsis]
MGGDLDSSSALSAALDTLPSRPWLASGGALVALYILYNQLLPKPLPGIPYDKEAAGRIMGSIPNLVAKRKRGEAARTFFPELFAGASAPVVQYFMGPWNKASVAVGDYRTVQELFVKHGKDFGRGHMMRTMWSNTMPAHFIGMEDDDPRLKRVMALGRDLMTPTALYEVNAPASYTKVLHHIELWQRKARLAEGHAFDAYDDLGMLTYDIIMAAALNIDYSDTQIARYTAYLDREPSIKLPNNPGSSSQGLAVFPPVELPDMLHSLNSIALAAGASLSTPFPQMYHFFNNRKPHMRKAYHDRDTIIKRYIHDSVRRLEAAAAAGSGGGTEAFKPGSAVDFIVKREATAAAKEGREPEYTSDTVIQIIFGYLLGGQESTNTTLAYTVKRLGSEQEAQRKLRAALREAYPEAYARRGEQPALRDVLAKQIPYLDAFIEEVLRVHPPAFGTSRLAKRDMEILGHKVPKGHMVFTAFTGATYNAKGYLDKERREQLASSSSHLAPGDGVADWADSDFAADEFHPERWLRVEDEEEGGGGGGAAAAGGGKGKVSFNQKAGPMMSFSAGPRACWGKRLAYLELKLVVTLLVWNFDFHRLPPELEDWVLDEELFVKPKTCRVLLSSAWDV